MLTITDEPTSAANEGSERGPENHADDDAADALLVAVWPEAVALVSTLAMWLLEVRSHALREFPKTVDIPPYAVLSHTWSTDEVLFQDIVTGNAPNCAGYAKILGCCRQAIADGFDFVVSNLASRRNRAWRAETDAPAVDR